MSAIVVSVELSGDVDVISRLADGCEKMGPFFEQVAVYGLSQAQMRLSERMSPDPDAVTSGHLPGSLAVGGPGNVLELGPNEVTYGSNLRHAAQVNWGGTIVPVSGKYLAIPLTQRLKRAGLWPRDIDPNRKILRFLPYRGAKPNIRALLIEDDDADEKTGYGPGPLFALASSVTQEGKHYLELTDADLEEIVGPMWQEHLGLSA